jgi:hypothetical protein
MCERPEDREIDSSSSLLMLRPLMFWWKIIKSSLDAFEGKNFLV